ncbi:beta/gamma crystallin-related protein [Hyphomonas pacifica]|uniref:Uncharacterized protein n=1 Tax=Hyphomonas pacifica TaxID=1280941 RepID=A0A062TXX0_9PROT|nr:beta/gamma crystallin-related protein [Hyphomonas pacifica]KCZ46187.1 hypothetical protein HY2_05765 [Hyphomonas pacifica]RAN35789.1 hypothetical protein HY3_06740 [Hyphomonas pacifica]
MFTKLIRFAAFLALPLTAAGTAAAQYEAAGEPAGLMLFSGQDYQGDVREVFEPVYTLNDYRFNDRARSVAVLSGAWELCEHSDFTGRCVFIRHDVADLDWYGLDYEISSARPIYEYTEAEHGLMFVRDDQGYIRYADNDRYGYDNYSHGYGVSTRVSVYHYGYSPTYRSYGYYDPRFGYGPYGFAWTRHGVNRHYGHDYRRDYRHRRPDLRGHYGARDGAVTLYVDSYERGASLGLNEGVSDLSRYRFNDNVSSIKIRSGKWEVCEHANFKGRCQIIDASNDKLNGLRLNDNISSIRPVDGQGHRGNRNDGDRRYDGPRGGRDHRGDRDDSHRGERRPHTEGVVTRTRGDGLAGGPASEQVRRPQPRPGQPVRADINRPQREGQARQDVLPQRERVQQQRVLPKSPAFRNREDLERPDAVQDVRRRAKRARDIRPVERRPQEARSTPRRAEPIRPQGQAAPQRANVQSQSAQSRTPVQSRPQARPQPQRPQAAPARPQRAQVQPPRPQPQARPQQQPQPQRNNDKRSPALRARDNPQKQ